MILAIIILLILIIIGIGYKLEMIQFRKQTGSTGKALKKKEKKSQKNKIIGNLFLILIKIVG